MKKAVLIIRWIASGLFFFIALGCLITGDILAAFFLAVFSFWTSPLSSRYLFNKLPLKLPIWTKVAIGSLIFIGFATTVSPPARKAEKGSPSILSTTDSPTPSDTIPTATSSPSIFESKEKAKVINVVDGDTIKLEDGRVVRYIGIDAPETVHPQKPVQCFGKEASRFNEELVEGKEVWLEKDISETDKYGRILRYVYVLGNDNLIMVNKILVEKGYAHASSYPPDIKYQEEFRKLEEEARQNKVGLWANNACLTSVPTQAPVQSFNPTTAPIQGSWTCDCSKTCSEMSSCAEAQYQLNVCGCTRRDADHDGIACDADCQ